MSYASALVQDATAEVPSDAAAADKLSIPVTAPRSFEHFIVVVSAALTANATRPVISVEVRKMDGSSAVEKLTVTLPASLAVGTYRFSNIGGLPLIVDAGNLVVIKHKTAEGATGGKYYAALISRIDGYKSDSASGVAS